MSEVSQSPEPTSYVVEGHSYRQLIAERDAYKRIANDLARQLREIKPADTSAPPERATGSGSSWRSDRHLRASQEVAMFEVHHLKTWPEPFQQLWDGTKRFEIRVFDRDYKTGDMVRLFEYDPKAEMFTGRYIRGDIGHIEKPGTWGLPETIGVFAVRAFECRCISPDRAWRWCSEGKPENEVTK